MYVQALGMHTACRYFIRRFGCGLNFDSGTHENYHQFVVRGPFDADCRREEGRTDRLAKRANERILVTTALEELQSDPPMRTPSMTLRARSSCTLQMFIRSANSFPGGEAQRVAIYRHIFRCELLQAVEARKV